MLTNTQKKKDPEYFLNSCDTMSVSEKNKAQSSKQGYLYLLEKSKFKKLKNFSKT